MTITIKTGPAFGELRTLEQQLEASAFLLKPSDTWSDSDMERAHVELEMMFLEQAEK
jgi:hypothetical protein